MYITLNDTEEGMFDMFCIAIKYVRTLMYTSSIDCKVRSTLK